MNGWIKDHPLLPWLAVASVVTLLISLLVLPVVVVKMRADYFLPSRDETRSLAHQHPVVRWTGVILKNFFGAMLFIAGVLMLALPGQGLLCILMGLMLMDFPGKQRLEIWIVRLPAVSRALNWIRKKGHRPPLEIPARNDGTAANPSPPQPLD